MHWAAGCITPIVHACNLIALAESLKKQQLLCACVYGKINMYNTSCWNSCNVSRTDFGFVRLLEDS